MLSEHLSCRVYTRKMAFNRTLNFDFFQMAPKPAVTKAAKPKAPARMVTKDIGGDKNGGKRTVRVKRMVRRLFFFLQNKYPL